MGRLRESEGKRPAERGKDTVTETCIGRDLTISREELNARNSPLLRLPPIAKAFSWLAREPAEYIQSVIPPSRSIHARTISFNALLASVDTAVLSHGPLHVLRFGPSITTLFIFELS